MTRRARGRYLAGLAGWLVAALVGTLLLTVAWSLAVGQRTAVVLSGSMEPALSPGDVLIERGVEPSQVRIGQIVTFHEPGTDRMLTHRVRKIENRGARLVFTTKGDADNSVQRWSIGAGGELGQPVRLIPKIGHAVMFAKTPLGFFAIVLLPLLALGGFEIFRIWRPRTPRDALMEARGAHS